MTGLIFFHKSPKVVNNIFQSSDTKFYAVQKIFAGHLLMEAMEAA